MRTAVLAVVLAVSVSVAHGAGIPVIDAGNLVENKIAALQNIEQTMKQIEQYQKQLEQFKEQIRNGMGMGDMLGQFQNMLSGFKNIQNQMSFNGNSMLGQFSGFGGGSGGGSGGAVDSSNYFQSGGSGAGGGGGGSNYFSAQSSGGSDFKEYSAIYGNPQEFYQMKQDAVRSYQTKGAEAQIATTDEWMNQLGEHQKRLDKEVEEGMAELQQMIREAGNDESGGTNKLLGVTNMLLMKLVEQNMVIQQMMVTREVAEVTQFKNANARMQDQEAQAVRLREDAESFQQQQQGTAPLKW